MAETFDVSEGAAYAVLYTVLASFTILAVLAAGYCGTGRLLQKLGCLMKSKTVEGSAEGTGIDNSADFFLAARSSAGAR